MLVKTYGAALLGIDAIIVTIEVSVSRGVNFFLVGLPDSVVRESQQRIESALQSVGMHLPGKKIVINMAPADIRKEGSGYDLPLAVGILVASSQLEISRDGRYLIMGELSLDGRLQPIKGTLPIAIKAGEEGFDGIILPRQNASEAQVVENLKVFGADSLRDVILFLKGEKDFAEISPESVPEAVIREDFSDVKGQENVKRALEIAASGGHNVIMIGPPGSGKTMLARRLAGILPPMTVQESLETTKIHSVAGKMNQFSGLIKERPFRAPHHIASDVAMVGGGGQYPHPGEISLAHNGMLFLDELPEFKKAVLEMLRQPLEDREITISRARYSVTYPSSFMLVASMNPCPCGYYNHPDKDCTCPPGAVRKYLHKVSGPLMDRIDMHIEVSPVPFAKISAVKVSETTAQIRTRVIRAREIQTKRFEGTGIFCNAQMNTSLLRRYCTLDKASSEMLSTVVSKLGFSARAYDRILKLARTIADMSSSERIEKEHIAEAIMYRSLDREKWGV